MVNEQLLSDLKADDPETRLDAYEEISVEMDDDLAKHIVAIAAGADREDIRADAAVALGPLLEEVTMDQAEAPVSRGTFNAIVEQLRAVYSDESQPKLVRRRAFESLVRHPQSWQRDEIRRHFSSSDDEWQSTAIFGMGAVSGFEKELMQLLTSSHGVTLAEAIRSAGSINLTDAADLIRDIAQDDSADRDARVEAILALPYVDEDAEDVLDEIVSEDPEIEDAVAIALDEINLIDDED